MSDAASSGALLNVAALSKSFGGLRAVDELSFQVQPGTISAVIGPNGAGKTTVFNLIAGSLRPDGGLVWFKGERITGLLSHQIAHLGLTRTFQTIRLCVGMTVLENVMLGRHSRTRAGFLPGLLRLPWTVREEGETRAKALEVLDLFGLREHADEQATELPFGLQRGVELARALAGEPDLLLLDEPASGLNIRETATLAAQIRGVRDQGVTILLVEHDMALVMDISDHITVLDRGRKIAEGSPEEVRRDRKVIDIYLGEDHAQAAEY